ncbi:MAG TPA: hypothetical protein PLY93_07640 [Turneriella sp.]|nr:hypothetical protein [Turneriella sp.]
MGYYKVSAVDFSLLYGISAAGAMLGSFLNGQLVRRFAPKKILRSPRSWIMSHQGVTIPTRVGEPVRQLAEAIFLQVFIRYFAQIPPPKRRATP